MDTEELGAQWDRICGGPSEQIGRVHRAVINSYCEPSRRYHGLAHVVGVVTRVNDLAQSQPTSHDGTTNDPAAAAAADLEAAVMAAWYHDVVYDPVVGGNEVASAERAARELCGLGLAAPFVKQVSNLVLMTIEHRPRDTAGFILADADLWTLGGSEPDYFAYGDLIRQEYAHVPDPAWRRGRAAFIEMFLGRSHIFSTPRGRAERETQARRNLRSELSRLTS